MKKQHRTAMVKSTENFKETEARSHYQHPLDLWPELLSM
jgi:hypothetical protein